MPLNGLLEIQEVIVNKPREKPGISNKT